MKKTFMTALFLTLSVSAFAQDYLNPDFISKIIEPGSYVGNCQIEGVKSINQQETPAGTYYRDALAQVSQGGNKTQILFQNGSAIVSDKTSRGTYVIKNIQNALVEGIKYTQITKIEVDPKEGNKAVSLTVEHYAVINGKKIDNKRAALKCGF